MSTLTWYGHSTVKIETERNTVIYIDPWLSSNPLNPQKELPAKADYILITHDHYDHVGDTVAIAQATGAKVVAQPETMEKLISQGLPSEQGRKMNIGGTLSMDGFEATMVHAFHTANSGVPSGYIMNIDGKIVYHMGDTGLFGDLRLFGELYPIDYALIPVGGNFTMDYRHGAVAAKLLNAKHVIPIHYRTFQILLQEPEPLIEEIKRLRLQTKVLAIREGETVDL